MKKDIHPEYKKAKVTCGCGNVIETKNTVGDLTVEICSACHPFFTGKQKLVDTAGRVDKFRAKMEAAEKLKASQKPKKEKVETKKVVDLDKKMEEIKEELKEETVETKTTSDVVETNSTEEVQEESTDKKSNSAEATQDK